MSRCFFWTIIIGVSFAAILAFGVFAYRHAGLWLLVSDPEPQRIDVIFTFGGEEIRKKYSLELARRHPDAHWVISNHNYKRTLNWVTEMNVAQSRITIVDTCASTFTEIIFLNEFISSNNLLATASNDDSIVQSNAYNVALVSSPSHMRRISVLAANTFDKQHITSIFLPVPFSFL